MERLIEFSVVITGNDCNPTILNPDFLAIRGIVPAEWQWLPTGAPLTTPAFSRVAFNSGVTLSVEPNKFQVVDNLTKSTIPETSRIAEIAIKYIENLPHVRYEAAGCNFNYFIEMPDARNYLKSRFLKPGAWDYPPNSLNAFSLKFVYPRDAGNLNLALDSAEITPLKINPPKTEKGILVQANYHSPASGYPSDKQIIKRIGRIGENWSDFQHMIKVVLGG
jgi:hypothetical protein